MSSLLSANWRGLGYIVRAEADSLKDFSRNAVRADSCFWKILLVLAGG